MTAGGGQHGFAARLRGWGIPSRRTGDRRGDDQTWRRTLRGRISRTAKWV